MWSKKRNKNKRPTNRANLSQNLDDRKSLPAGVDKRGGINPK